MENKEKLENELLLANSVSEDILTNVLNSAVKPAIESIESFSPVSSRDMEGELTSNDQKSFATLLSPAASNDHTNSQTVISKSVEHEEISNSAEKEEPRTLRHRRSTGDHPSPLFPKRKYTVRDKSIASNTLAASGLSRADKPPETENKPRKLIPRRPGIEWKVGGKLEAMDFFKKWYPARIVEVDEGDTGVLIHFDKWSTRFDEWLDMRSGRLRASAQMGKDAVNSSHSQRLSQKPFLSKIDVGTVVLAQWKKPSKSSKYPAVVKEVLSKFKINIEFYDGVELQTDLSSVQRLEPTLQKEALRIWDIMKDINTSSESEELSETKISRRESIETKKAQQAKMDAAEALLSKLIENSSKSAMNKHEKSEVDLSEKPDPKSLTKPAKEDGTSPNGCIKEEPGKACKSSAMDSRQTPQVTGRGRPPSANKTFPASKKIEEKTTLKKRASETPTSPPDAKMRKLSKSVSKPTSRTYGGKQNQIGEKPTPKKKASETPASPPDAKMRKLSKVSKPTSRTYGGKQRVRRTEKLDGSGPACEAVPKAKSPTLVTRKRRHSMGKSSGNLIVAGFAVAKLPTSMKVATSKCYERSASVVLDQLTPSKLSRLHVYASNSETVSEEAVDNASVVSVTSSEHTEVGGNTRESLTEAGSNTHESLTESTAERITTPISHESNEKGQSPSKSPSSDNEALAVHVSRHDAGDGSVSNTMGEVTPATDTHTTTLIPLGTQAERLIEHGQGDNQTEGEGEAGVTTLVGNKPSGESGPLNGDENSTDFNVKVSSNSTLRTTELLSHTTAYTRNLMSAVVSLEKRELLPVTVASLSSTSDSSAPRVRSKRSHSAKTASIPSASRHTARRSSQSADSKPKVGYTVVLEPVDAKPAKAFVVEENHNQFQCTYCQKGFRKDSLLASHIKYFHNAKRDKPVASAGSTDTGPSTTNRRHCRRKTLSVCSNDSELVTPISTAPPTPLASPTPPKEMYVMKKQPIKSTPKESGILAEADSDYEAETDEESVDDPFYQTEVVNCKCGFNEEDGLMIQCEFCCCWQHVDCFGIKPNEEPDPYLCFICLDTHGVRDSCKYMYNQDWARNGSLPKFDCSASDADSIKIESIVKKSQDELIKLQHQLSAMGSVERLLDSASKGDMYELALWSSEEETELDPTSEHGSKKLGRQERLLLHIQAVSNNMELELDAIESKLSDLESEAETVRGLEEPPTSQSLLTLARDLRKVAEFSTLLKEEPTEVPDFLPE